MPGIARTNKWFEQENGEAEQREWREMIVSEQILINANGKRHAMTTTTTHLRMLGDQDIDIKIMLATSINERSPSRSWNLD